jgi:hypothetical protein
MKISGRQTSANIEPPNPDNGDFWELVLRGLTNDVPLAKAAYDNLVNPLPPSLVNAINGDVERNRLAESEPANTRALRATSATGLVPGPLWGDETLTRDHKTGKFVTGLDSQWLRDSLASNGSDARHFTPTFQQHLTTGSTSSNIEDRSGQKFTGVSKALTGTFGATDKGAKMPNNSLYDGILMPQGGVYEPGPAVMLPPSAPAKQSAVVRALIASDPIGMGPGGGTGWDGYSSTIDDNSLRSFDQIRADARPPTTVDAANPLDVTRLGLTNDPFRTPAETAIETYAPHSAAFSPWGPDWTTGIGAVHQPMLLGSPGQFAGGDPWAADRFGDESVAPRPGMVTGAAPSISPVAAALVAANARPITYSAPVAAGNFAEGSPNQSFEKQNGMGSVTKSMAESSRWNGGY